MMYNSIYTSDIIDLIHQKTFAWIFCILSAVPYNPHQHILPCCLAPGPSVKAKSVFQILSTQIQADGDHEHGEISNSRSISLNLFSKIYNRFVSMSL